jgi:pyruvate/2-oxoglutarate/acetoin dehydrogenase E1 component
MPTVLDRLNHGLHHAMESDSRVYFVGEDVLDPYGGAFKVARGLSTRFPERVLTTPISEAAIVGVSNGMALRGLRPVAEIMFGDFIALAADQLVNHTAKFRWMYNDHVRVPLVVRAPMGGRRGYGPTHSQSLEKLFLGVPGLKVVAPNTLGDPAELLLAAIADDDPVLFIEHKLLYTRPLLEMGKGELANWRAERTGGGYPTFILHPEYPPALTIATYGYNFELARAAALQLLMEHEIFTELVLFSQLSPFDGAPGTGLPPLLTSLESTRRLLTVEESTISLGWGAEIAARAAESGNDSPHGGASQSRHHGGHYAIRRAAALDLPIANSRPLEDAILPSVESIVELALSMTVQGRAGITHGQS